MITLRGELLSLDGTRIEKISGTAPVEDGAALGGRLGAELLAKAGPDFL